MTESVKRNNSEAKTEPNSWSKIVSLIATIDQILESTKLDPKTLELEFPETAFSLLSEKQIAPILKSLSDRGISLAVDQFGSGSVRIQDLKKMNINRIKLEGISIQNISHDEYAKSFLAAVLVMAASLGIKTVGKGVETKNQLQFLKDKDCDFIQGFYFIEPITPEQFVQLLLKQKNYKV